MTQTPTIKRILRECKEIKQDPLTGILTLPLENNLFEWHFTILGVDGTEFENGRYHGKIILPSEYPFKPPDVIMLNQSGRFEIGKKICLNFSGFHPEQWQPSWTIRTMLVALRAFMATPAAGAVGAIEVSPQQRKLYAKKSVEFACAQCKVQLKDLPLKNDDTNKNKNNDHNHDDNNDDNHANDDGDDDDLNISSDDNDNDNDNNINNQNDKHHLDINNVKTTNTAQSNAAHPIVNGHNNNDDDDNDDDDNNNGNDINHNNNLNNMSNTHNNRNDHDIVNTIVNHGNNKNGNNNGVCNVKSRQDTVLDALTFTLIIIIIGIILKKFIVRFVEQL
jgi:ubiquitin-conjugating enzyme E2 J1